MSRLLYGDPCIAAMALEKAQRREQRMLAGTGCDTCQHASHLWDLTVCEIGRRHPGCVFAGCYLPKKTS